MRVELVGDLFACCELCSATVGCLLYNFQQSSGSCELLETVSGQLVRPHPRPHPPPPPPPPLPPLTTLATLSSPPDREMRC